MQTRVWEYDTIVISGPHLNDRLPELNARGKQGWELVGVAPVAWQDPGDSWMGRVEAEVALLLKRQRDD